MAECWRILTGLWVICGVVLTGSSVMSQDNRATQPTTDQAAARPIRIVIAGDSTVASYPPSHRNRGWGQYIEGYFKLGTVKVINLAKPGRSTRTFFKEGLWRKVLDERPDYVLIQFGHNDSHAPGNPESTVADQDFSDYLRKFIDEARAIGATPILVTPMVRRDFDQAGKIVEGQATGNLVPYAQAMKRVGKEKGVAVIDLYASSKALAEKLGPEASAKMASRRGDITHFNEAGARAMAGLVMKDLLVDVPALKGVVTEDRP